MLNKIWPPSLHQLVYFIAYMKAAGFSPSTGRSYLAGLSFHLKIGSYQDNTDHFLIKKMLEGFSRSSSTRDARAPITFDLLQKIVSVLNTICTSEYETFLFGSAFLLAFFCFLRVGELAVKSKSDHTKVLNISDITMSQNEMQVTIRHSKTDQYGKGCTLVISKSVRNTSLFQYMLAYLKQRQTVSSKLLFTHWNGSPLTAYQFSSVLNKALTFLQIDTATFKSHSFRIGAATQAHLDGISEENIKKLGRWKSNCFSKYIRL